MDLVKASHWSFWEEWNERVLNDESSENLVDLYGAPISHLILFLNAIISVQMFLVPPTPPKKIYIYTHRIRTWMKDETTEQKTRCCQSLRRYSGTQIRRKMLI